MGENDNEQPTSTPPVAPPENNRRPSMLMEAEKAASRLDNLNKELERKLERLEALRVEETLSGKANVHVQKQEETPEEYAEKVLRGDIVGTDEY